MQTTTQGMEISVAILMDDLASAKEISSALRSYNIFAHHYPTLEEFWVAVSLQTPDLVIVDVTKMSQGSVQFRNHPKVIGQTLKYAFFSKDSTKMLLQSTMGLEPMMYLHSDITLSSQVKSLVEALTYSIKSSQNIKELQTRVDRLQSRSQRLLSDRSDAEEFRANFEFIRTLTSELEEEAAKADFTSVLISKLEKWEAIDGYGIYELNQSGQKLVSPEISRKKYHPFPSLWLGQVNSFGIENFAQEMAMQVANDLFEMEPVMIKVHAGAEHPDMVLFVSFKEERMINFPWDVFQTSLSSSLRRVKLNRQMPQYSSQFMPMWEALDSMDKMQQTIMDSDTRIIALSLIPLTEVAKRRSQNKFYWSAFFNDFFLQLSGRLQKSTKLSLFGPWHVIFFIPKENLETETQMLQSFVKNFSYWKFFEDNSQILSENMMPILKMIPASSAHYFRVFEKEFEDGRMDMGARNIMDMSKSPSPGKLTF